MLTRFRISGFKNLIDVDIHFGPVTCIAGPNGVGKSNLFDAIHFLSLLADHTLMEAASSIRAEGNQSSDIKSLFFHLGEIHEEKIRFVADMIIPEHGIDDLGQPAKASITTLRYHLEIGYKLSSPNHPENLEILFEELKYLKKSDLKDSLLFPTSEEWKDSAIIGRKTSPFISTEIKTAPPQRIIKLHQDQIKGRPLVRNAATLRRTFLSVTNTAESPTVLLAKREMQSWRLLQLEPASLRQPDNINAPVKISADGLHLPATLYRLANQSEDPQHIYSEVGNRLSELIDDVKSLWVEKDIKRELLTVNVQDFQDSIYPARALSDGTLRFLALTVLEVDTETQAVLCLEEPENGIHPGRISAMISLLEDIACDPQMAIGPDNPLRQVIINTHSPVVVLEVEDTSLLIAVPKYFNKQNQDYKSITFKCLPKTWRSKNNTAEIIPKAEILKYLNPVDKSGGEQDDNNKKRVTDRDDYLQPLLFEHFLEQR